jgi:hypothetical protein
MDVGAIIKVYPPNSDVLVTQTSVEQGYYMLTLAPGSYHIVIEATGPYAHDIPTDTRDVLIVSGTITPLDLSLPVMYP